MNWIVDKLIADCVGQEYPRKRGFRSQGTNGLRCCATFDRGLSRQTRLSARSNWYCDKEISIPARQWIFDSAEARATSIPRRVCKERATKAEAKRQAARRVAPGLGSGVVAPRSQVAADMLPRRA